MSDAEQNIAPQWEILSDLVTTILDSAPEELPRLHSKLVALADCIDLRPINPVDDAKDSFKHVQKLVKEGKISDNAAAFAVAVGAKPVDGELRKQVQHILGYCVYVGEGQACDHVMANNDDSEQNEHELDQIMQLFDAHLQAAVRKTEERIRREYEDR